MHIAEKLRQSGLPVVSMLITMLALTVFSPRISAGTTSTGVQFTLTEALNIAIQCGPAFREQMRLQERKRLNVLSELNAKQPALRLSAGTSINPDANSGATVNMSWQLSETASVRLTVPFGTQVVPPASASSPAARKSLTLDWSRRVWPVENDELQEAVRMHQQEVGELEITEHYFNAILEVMNHFYDWQESLDRAGLAERSLQLARDRADDAFARYENGFIGLSGLQEEQRLHHQAKVAAQRALLERERAWERLARVIGSAACGGVTVEPDVIGVDDFAWDRVVAELADVLPVSTPDSSGKRGVSVVDPLHSSTWETEILSYNLPYRRALITVLQTQATLAKAEDGLQPAVNVGAGFNSDLTATPPNWSLHINAVWDLGLNRFVDRDKAKLDAEAAKDQLDQARATALETGRAAWQAVSDALYGVELAEDALMQAKHTEDIVARRMLSGLAPAVEKEQARLEVDRRQLELRKAQSDYRFAWLRLGQRLGVGVEIE